MSGDITMCANIVTFCVQLNEALKSGQLRGRTDFKLRLTGC